MDITTMMSERNEALLSLDAHKILAYADKYGVQMPSDPDAFWAVIHKARCLWAECPADARSMSELWLRSNGWDSP